MADMAALPRFGVICKDVGVIDVLQMFVSCKTFGCFTALNT